MVESPTQHRALAVVAEDDAILRFEVHDFLCEQGFAVVGAGNTAQALARIAEIDQLAVLFTDVRMPGAQDGLDLARAVAERFPEARVIVCSAFPEPAPEAMPAGARFFTKPYHWSAIRRALG